jgi:hypothetical protein
MQGNNHSVLQGTYILILNVVIYIRGVLDRSDFKMDDCYYDITVVRLIRLFFIFYKIDR